MSKPTNLQRQTHELSHKIWESLRANAQTPRQLATGLGISLVYIRPILGDWERLGFIRLEGDQYSTVVALPIRKHGDRFVLAQ
jgi:hypothetical protein